MQDTGRLLSVRLDGWRANLFYGAPSLSSARIYYLFALSAAMANPPPAAGAAAAAATPAAKRRRPNPEAYQHAGGRSGAAAAGAAAGASDPRPSHHPSPYPWPPPHVMMHTGAFPPPPPPPPPAAGTHRAAPPAAAMPVTPATSGTPTNNGNFSSNNNSTASTGSAAGSPLISAKLPPLPVAYVPQTHACPTCRIASQSHAFVTRRGPHHLSATDPSVRCPRYVPGTTAKSFTSINDAISREYAETRERIERNAEEQRVQYMNAIERNKSRQLMQAEKVWREAVGRVMRVPNVARRASDGVGGARQARVPVPVPAVQAGREVGQRGTDWIGPATPQQQQQHHHQPVPVHRPTCAGCAQGMDAGPAAMCTTDGCRAMLCPSCLDDHRATQTENSWCSDCGDVVNIVCGSCLESRTVRERPVDRLGRNEFLRCRSLSCERYVCPSHVRMRECAVCGRQPFCFGRDRQCRLADCEGCGRKLCGQMLCALKEGCVCGKRREDPNVDWAITIMGEARRQGGRKCAAGAAGGTTRGEENGEEQEEEEQEEDGDIFDDEGRAVRV